MPRAMKASEDERATATGQDNAVRVEKVAEILIERYAGTAGVPCPLALAGLMGDICHYCRDHDLDVEDVLAHGREHFQAECAEALEELFEERGR